MQINECAGYGIRNFPTTGVIGMGCGDHWDQMYRYYLATAIAKAEKRMEADRWLGFPLRRKYDKPRQLAYCSEIALGKYLRGTGIETNTFVDTVDLTLSVGGIINDPVEFTIDVDFTDIDEFTIQYPTAYFASSCKDYLIRPSCVTISGGTATVQIPRARLLLPEFFLNYQNVNDRPDYEEDANFLNQVDIYRNYLNTCTGTNLVWWKHSGPLYCHADVSCEISGSCADVRQLACTYISNQRMGYVRFEVATCENGVYTTTTPAVRRMPDGIEINFMRGYYDRYDEMDEDIQRAVIAWAHNNMPQDYCSCSVQTKYWQDDNKPVEPPIRMGSGKSTWGNYYAEQILREFDAKHYAYPGGML